MYKLFSLDNCNFDDFKECKIAKKEVQKILAKSFNINLVMLGKTIFRYDIHSNILFIVDYFSSSISPDEAIIEPENNVAVSNNIQKVLNFIRTNVSEDLLYPLKQIIYMDSIGCIDEIILEKGEFSHIAPGGMKLKNAFVTWIEAVKNKI